MFEHRQKTIGKSTYTIVNVYGGYKVQEVYEDYRGRRTALSKYTHRMIDDAIEEMRYVDEEGHYTDSSARFAMCI